MIYNILAIILLAVASLTLSIVVRLRARRPMFRPTFDNALFVETWASGQLLKPWRPPANNIVWVVIAGGRLRTGLHFPCTLWFTAEISGMDWDIELSRVRVADVKPALFGVSRVRLSLLLPDGRERVLRLRLHDGERFVQVFSSSPESRIKVAS